MPITVNHMPNLSLYSQAIIEAAKRQEEEQRSLAGAQLSLGAISARRPAPTMSGGGGGGGSGSRYDPTMDAARLEAATKLQLQAGEQSGELARMAEALRLSQFSGGGSTTQQPQQPSGGSGGYGSPSPISYSDPGGYNALYPALNLGSGLAALGTSLYNQFISPK